MIYPSLSIITESPPVKVKSSKIAASVKRKLRWYIKGKVQPDQNLYGGHNAVTRSLIEGLGKLKATFNYNPPVQQLFQTVIVLSGIQKLKEALELKKEGKIKLLLAGPNMVDHVLDYNSIVADPLIDYFIVPSEWVKKIVLEDCIALRGRILVWPAGINASYWTPGVKKRNNKKVLLYIKTESESFHKDVERLVIANKLKIIKIEYKNYDAALYKKFLDKASFAIFISRSESQGIALAECWSMDVPTLVFNPGNFMYGGKNVKDISASPFLTNECGKEWNSLQQLETLIHEMKNKKVTFRSRQYALKFFTDENAAKRLLEHVQNVINN